MVFWINLPKYLVNMDIEDDSEELSVYSTNLNRETTAEAIQRGAQDATEAYEVYHEDEDEEEQAIAVRKTFEQRSFKTCAPVAPYRRQRSINAATA